MLCYFWYSHVTRRFGGAGPTGGTWEGIVYGSLGLGLMIFCGLLGVRKRVRIWRVGRAQTWMKAHIWLGLLCVPLVFCHSGMKLGNGLTAWIMVMFIAVTVTGIAGVVMQMMVPKLMLDRLQAETTFEQIPQVIQVIRDEADDIVTRICGAFDVEPANANSLAAAAPLAAAVEAAGPQLPQRGTIVMSLKKEGAIQGKTYKEKGKAGAPLEGSEPLKVFYVKEIRPFLSDRYDNQNKLASSDGAAAYFEYTRALLPVPMHDALHDLQTICEERRQMAMQMRLHFWLHGWQIVHVPVSYMLLVLTVVHAFVTMVRF